MVSPLPPELLLRILELVLDQKPRNPIPLLLVNSEFNSLCLSILQSVLRFSSIRQLDCFIRTCHKLVYRPRDLLITLPGGTADFRLFKLFHDLVVHVTDISQSLQLGSDKDKINGQRKIGLRRIQLCLNSHVFDENCKHLCKALEIAGPEEFMWMGPDPAHHFSIAIVPIAASYLFKAMRTWTNLRRLKLTNMAYPRSEDGVPIHPLADALGVANRWAPPSSGRNQDQVAKSSSPMPYLQTIYLGQVTFLDPSEIARIACAAELVSLTSIRVIDAYQGSIWGPRVRNADVERAASTLLSSTFITEQENDGVYLVWRQTRLDRAKTLVSCEALTERIMGGDRMDYDN